MLALQHCKLYRFSNLLKMESLTNNPTACARRTSEPQHFDNPESLGTALGKEFLRTVTDDKWRNFCGEEFEKQYCENIFTKLAMSYKSNTIIYPPKEQIFRAFSTPRFDDIKVVIIGQDPYHNAGQANGFCFAVHENIVPPPSLKNIFGSIKKLGGGDSKVTGSERTLEDWAEQGVFMLNTILTVDGTKKALSHRSFGWEKFTDAALRYLGQEKKDIVWLLLGRLAQSKKQFAVEKNCVMCPHPSPLSARLFFQTQPFEEVNEKLIAMGKEPINWISSN